jgi:hypothetical protein
MPLASDTLDENRRALADDHYEAYDFEPYRVEQSDGWSSMSGRGPTSYTRTVYVVPPREDGTPGDVDDDASVNATLTVHFADNSTDIVYVEATINGETIGKPAPITTNATAITPVNALKAILARIDGRFDEPALVAFGDLKTNTMDDIKSFAERGLAAEEKAA